LRGGAEGLELVEGVLSLSRFVEEIADAQIECLQDFQQRIEADLVLSLLHAGEVGLMNADLLRKLHLRQLSLASELADFSTDELELRWPIHARFGCYLCCDKINCTAQSTDY